MLGKTYKFFFEDKGLMRRLSLLRILFNLKLELLKTMDDYVTKVMFVAQQKLVRRM